MSDNQSNNKRIAKNTIMLYLRMILIMVIRLYTSRVILDVLGVDDYGLYNVIGGMVVMFTFINNAMTDSTQRFLTYEIGQNSNDRVAVVFRTSRYIHFFIALLFFIILELFGYWFICSQMTIPKGREEACLWVMHLSVVTTILKIINVPYNSMIIANERMNIFALLSISEAILLLLILLVLEIAPGDKLIIYGLLILIVQVIIQVCYNVYCQRAFVQTKLKPELNKALFKKMLSFAGWNVCGNMAQMFSTHGLNMLLNVFFSPAVNAARGIAVTVQGAVGQFSGSFQSALNPQITKSYSSGNLDYLYKLINSSSKYTFYLLLVVALPTMFETPYLLSLWLKEVPMLSVVFLRLILITTIIEAVINPFNVAVAATGNIKKYQIFNGLITISVLPLAAIAFEFGCGAEYAFLIQVFLSVMSFIARFIIMKNSINVDTNKYLKDVIFRCILVSILSIITPIAITHVLQPSMLRLIITTISSLVFTVLIIYTIGITREERLFVSQFIKNKIK